MLCGRAGPKGSGAGAFKRPTASARCARVSSVCADACGPAAAARNRAACSKSGAAMYLVLLLPPPRLLFWVLLVVLLFRW